MSKVSPSISVLIALLLCHFGMSARAVVFDWDSGTYGSWGGTGAPSPGNTVTRNFNSDPTRTGNDISISIANSAANPSGGGSGFAWTGGSPVVDNTSLNGGTSQEALQLLVLRGNPNGITVTINFINYPGGVNNVSFTLWDVDRNDPQFTDVISNITATTFTGGTVNPTSVTGSANNSVANVGGVYTVSGTNASNDTGAGSANGNTTITFGAGNITSVTFTWRNGSSGLGQQYIGLHDITYTPVPEVGTSLAALGVCLGATLVRRRRALAV